MKTIAPLLFSLFAVATLAAAPVKLPTASERFSNLAQAEEPSFRRHVIPLMSRLGCSGRECHGAFAGQGGFQLSLFGYDFEKDHKEITQDSDGGEAEVRVNAQQPLESLIVKKGAALTRHKGKERFAKDSWEYNLLAKWVQSGAKLDVEQTGEFDRLEVFPKEIVFGKAGDAVQLKVLAHWKDGTVEDVTQITRFRSNDDSVAAISDTGKVESKGKGDTHIVAFYDNGVLPIPVMLAMSEFTGTKYPKVPTRTKVDELVVAKLRKAGIVPSEVCTDSEFLRRVHLDLTATPPTPDEVRAFLADKSPDKRAKKVEELLKTPGYAAWWTTLLCDFTGNNPRQLNTGGNLQLSDRFSRQWYDWIYKRVSDNTPYDKLVEGIVLARGRTSPDQSYEEYAKEMASYFRDENRVDFASRHDMPYFWQRQNVNKAEEKALAFAHTFLGVRIECAQCHKHPFDQWTQTDFKQFQAFFEPVSFGVRTDKKDQVNYNSVQKAISERIGYDPKKNNKQKELQQELAKLLRAGEVIPLREVFVRPQEKPRQLSAKEIEQRKKRDPNFSGRVLTPKILGGEEVMLNEFPDPRKPLMEWLRGQDNPYFARAWVNRAWAAYFGRGIVEPADDMNLANPPSNAELMDHLATGFAKSGYDMKWLHREIINSDTYQRSWKPTPSNKLDEKNFSRSLIRRLPAEVVFDSIAMATASSTGAKKVATDLDNRAIGPNASISGKARGGDNYTLTTFGKPARLANCDCERTSDPTLLQTLYTRNDPTFLSLVDSAKRDGSGWIEELRRAASPEFSPERIKAEIAKFEAGKERVLKQRAEREKGRVLAEKDRQKYEREIAELDTRIARSRATLAESEKRSTVDFDRAIEEVFLRTVSRPPTNDELAKARADVDAASDKVNGVRDLLWAMLNTREFMVNH
jgi:Protein of unknown function (DUF1549)/Protein of unknown function (DUF1553)